MGGQSGSAGGQYGQAIVLGIVSGVGYSLVWIALVVPIFNFQADSMPVESVLVLTYGLTPALIGLVFGLLGLYGEPFGLVESVVAAGLTLSVAGLFVLRFPNPSSILATLFALCLIASESYLIPRAHGRVLAKQDGILTVELRTVLVPVVTLTLLLTGTVSGAVMINEEGGSDQCGIAPQASWNV